jgi:hypothetical protein
MISPVDNFWGPARGTAPHQDGRTEYSDWSDVKQTGKYGHCGGILAHINPQKQSGAHWRCSAGKRDPKEVRVRADERLDPYEEMMELRTTEVERRQSGFANAREAPARAFRSEGSKKMQSCSLCYRICGEALHVPSGPAGIGSPLSGEPHPRVMLARPS